MARLEISTAVRWEVWRRLYPLYCALAREFVLEIPPCEDLAAVTDIPSAENVAEVDKWVSAMDARIHIHHLRHFAQTSPLMSEEAIADFLLHSLGKSQKTAEAKLAH